MASEILALKNARLLRREGLWDVVVDDGVIKRITKHADESTSAEFDADGCLVTESFVIAHLHLDKVRTAERAPTEALARYQEGRMDSRSSIIRAHKLASKVKESYHQAEIVTRARRAAEEALHYGVTHMRAFADTDTMSKLEAVKALITLRKEFKGRLEIQVVAFPQEGVEADPGAEEYVEKAAELGADVVGGIPWLERDEAKQRRHIDKMFAVAKKHNLPITMIVDDAGDPELRTLEMLAAKTIKEGWGGKVSACHAKAMQVYPDSYAKKVSALCAKAGVGIVSNPHTAPLHARVDLLEAAGATVALGQDDCLDAFYPYGRCNMLEVAFLSSHVLRMMSLKDEQTLYDMVTVNPARIIGVSGFGLDEGNRANLVVLGQMSIQDAFTYHDKPRLVISHGAVVGQSVQSHV